MMQCLFKNICMLSLIVYAAKKLIKDPRVHNAESIGNNNVMNCDASSFPKYYALRITVFADFTMT